MPTRPETRTALLLALALSATLPASAQEQVLMPPLDGWEVGYRAADETGRIIEWVLPGETVEDWSELVTFQAFPGLAGLDPKLYSGRLAEMIGEACEGTQTLLLFDGEERGQSVVVFLTGCPLNPATGVPEYTLFKVMEGREALYVAQKAWKSEPGEVEADRWLTLLASVGLCAPDRPEAPCP